MRLEFDTKAAAQSKADLFTLDQQVTYYLLAKQVTWTQGWLVQSPTHFMLGDAR